MWRVCALRAVEDDTENQLALSNCFAEVGDCELTHYVRALRQKRLYAYLCVAVRRQWGSPPWVDASLA